MPLRVLKGSARDSILAASTSLAPPSSPRVEASALTRPWAQLEKLLRSRLRKCMVLLPKVLSEDGPEAVHDLRVWSRRLQQVVVTLFPDPGPPEARSIVKALRGARRSLGGWRDCDVLIGLLERKARRIRNLEQKHTWEMVRDRALKRRARQVRRARRKLANRKLFTLALRAEKLMERRSLRDGEPNPDPRDALVPSVGTAYAQWRESLSRACDSFTPGDIHAFRIRTKSLRYRIELVRDLGDGAAQTALLSLKTLQDELGRWHDNTELSRLAAEALADPEFLLQHSGVAAAILRKIEHDNAFQLERVRRLLAATREGAETSAVHIWIVCDCGQTASHLADGEASRDRVVADTV